MDASQPGATQLLRHALATLAYRGAKVVRDAPDGFEHFTAGEGTRSAGAVLAHLCDLLDWSFSLCDGAQVWKEREVEEWQPLCAHFFAALGRLDARLASPEAPKASLERLFQGPVADALTHVGQIALLRRLAGHPVRPENYFRAEISAGNVGADQAVPRREF